MITQRIKIIMDAHGLSASAFADKLQIQRSGMSHLFSGRNNPSLDLVLKILHVFPEVTSDWLLQGIGTYPPEGEAITLATGDVSGNDEDQYQEDKVTDVNIAGKEPQHSDSSERKRVSQGKRPEEGRQVVGANGIIRIIALHDDGTFSSYERRENRD